MRKIELSRGLYALVDDDDFTYLNSFNWHAKLDKCGSFYAARNYIKANGRKSKMTMHRLIMNASKGEIIDHKDHNTLDNQKCNLRSCDKSKNGMNRLISSNNTIGLKGVTMHKSTGKYQAQIKKEGERFYLGLFTTAEAAHKAYCVASTELHGVWGNKG